MPPLNKSEISLSDGKMKKQSENKFWEEKNRTILTYQNNFLKIIFGFFTDFLSLFLEYNEL